MAIQLRRGAYENYDASKLKPAEVGVVQSGDPNTTDGKAVYIAINTNDVKRIPTADEMVDHNAEAEGIYENIVAQNQTASQLYQNTSIKAAEAEQSASSASSASASANSSMQRAETAADLLTNVTATAQTLETGQQATASYNNGVFSFGLPKGDTGNTGAKGDKGDTGATPNLSVGTVTTLEPGSDATVEITGTAEAPVLNMGIPRGNTGEVSAEQFYKAFATDTATGAVANFSDGADSIPMKDVLVHIEPVQAGSGDPSPENVRPITGWTEAKVTRTGKNLLDITEQSSTTNGVTFTVNSDGTIVADGTATATIYFAIQRNIAIPAGEYILTGCPSGGSPSTFSLSSQINSRWNGSDYGSGRSVSLNEDGNGLAISRIEIVIVNGTTVSNLVFKPMLRLASDTDSTYEPYSGQTYDITFPTEAGTVYGGTLDVTKGELVVDRVAVVLDGSNITVDGKADYGKYIRGVFGYKARMPAARYNGSNTYVLADKLTISYEYTVGVNASKTASGFWVYPHSSGLFITMMSADYPSIASINAWFAENTPTVCYELATPITYQLTPQEITSLLGENNLWADTGNSEVEYRADTKMYIRKKITEAVSALS